MRSLVAAALLSALCMTPRSFAELCTLQSEDGRPLHLEDIQLLQCDSLLCLRIFPAPLDTLFAEFAGVPRHEHHCLALSWNGDLFHAWVFRESPCCIKLERIPVVGPNATEGEQQR